MIDSPYQVQSSGKIKLNKIAPDDTGPFKHKDDAAAQTDKNLAELKCLQERLYANGQHAILIVLQAMDAGGKDGAIEHVFGGVNPQGCTVTSFKVPTHLEAAHDFLWRGHLAAPPKGMIGIFNRSHYESVLVERVKDLTPKKVWSRRYELINYFEKILADEGTTILKFFLHISKKEQKERLQARLDDPQKHWKFNPADLVERKRWNKYQKAYEDALGLCSKPHAPWYIVPADHKWYRNWVISDLLVRTMKEMDLRFPPAPKGLDKIKID